MPKHTSSMSSLMMSKLMQAYDAKVYVSSWCESRCQLVMWKLSGFVMGPDGFFSPWNRLVNFSSGGLRLLICCSLESPGYSQAGYLLVLMKNNEAF
jgi:hypothetical protein